MENHKSISEIMDETLPLNRMLGFTTILFEPGTSAVKVTSTPLHQNHVGSIHAGVIFSLAEYTSGSVLLGAILDDMDKIFSVVKNGNIEYLTAAKDSIVAYGSLNSNDIYAAKEMVLNGEKVDINVEIIIKNEADSSIVAKAKFLWALRKIKQLN